MSREVPGSDAMRRTIAAQSVLQRRLWRLAGEALATAPTANATRLRRHPERHDRPGDRPRRGLNNRVPGAVLGLEVIGGAVVVGLLALYLAVLGRGLLAAFVAAGLVTLLLLVTFDLDRPTRGLIEVTRRRRSRRCVPR